MHATCNRQRQTRQQVKGIKRSSINAIIAAATLAAAAPASAAEITLTATFRDFLDSHADFEQDIGGSDHDIVADTLGPDRKPVYAPGASGSTLTTNGKTEFDQWYRDVPGVNMTTTKPLILLETATPGTFSFTTGAFYPIDDELFGNQGRTHNYHFTTEIHGEFTYGGGEIFGFTGDDDVFAFINGIKVIDIGGIHGAIGISISLDAKASELGLVLGETYEFDFFHAERQTIASAFTFTTSIDLEDTPLSTSVSEPATGILFAGGLLGSAWLRRRIWR